MIKASLFRASSICCLSIALSVHFCSADSFSDGVAAFNRHDYSTATTSFRAAQQAKPDDARALLWLGLALYGSEGLRPAMDTWNKISVNDYNDWGMTAALFKGLAYWSAGDKSNAEFFLDPTVKRRGYEAVVKAAKQLKADGNPPPLAQWPVGTPLVAAPAKTAPGKATAGKAVHGAAGGALKPAPPVKKIDVKRPLPSNAPVAKHGSATAPKFGRFKVGDEVMVRSGGKLWWRGKVTMVHRDKQFNGYYRVETRTGLDDYWHTQVAGIQREPYWTKFFVGTWEVRVPVAANVVTSGNSAHRVYSGGMKLPPLKINGNGTYTWALLNKKTIHGHWKPRPDAPGIILQKGEYGADWTLYNASDKSTRQVFKRDVIYLTSEKHTYQEAYRAK